MPLLKKYFVKVQFLSPRLSPWKSYIRKKTYSFLSMDILFESMKINFSAFDLQMLFFTWQKAVY